MRPLSEELREQDHVLIKEESINGDERFIYHPSVREKAYITFFSAIFLSTFIIVCLLCGVFFIFNISRYLS
ncbi:MAG: hypothetical protein ACW98K_18755 [Candidatus Kariarchaeaceae archaeon]|jgi:hypothetical protein